MEGVLLPYEKVKKESDTKTTEEVQVKTYEEVTSEKA